MDPTTFGGSDAAIILVDRLAKLDDPKLAKRVGSFLNMSATGFARLDEIEDHEWFRRFAILWRNSRTAMIEFHPEIDTYVRNVLVTGYKEWVRGCKA